MARLLSAALSIISTLSVCAGPAFGWGADVIDAADKAVSGPTAADDPADCLPNQYGENPDWVCFLPIDGVTQEQARAALGGEVMAVTREGDEILVFAAHEGEGPLQLCCSVGGEMERIGESDLWAARVRLAELDRAMLSFAPPAKTEAGGGAFEFTTWRGPEAPPPPAETPFEDMQGEVVERTLWSEHLQETRKLQIYLPPGYDPARDYSALYHADGVGEVLMVEALIRKGAVPPVVIIGMQSGQRGIVEDRSDLGIQDLRSADYLHGFPQGGDRFARHMRYVTEELVPWAEREYSLSSDPEDRVVLGSSNGANFALQAALLHPEVFGSAFVMSAGWKPLSADDIAAAPQRAKADFYMSAGLYEPDFHKSTRASAEVLREAGYDVRFESLAAGHMMDQRKYMQAENMKRLFDVENRADDASPGEAD